MGFHFYDPAWDGVTMRIELRAERSAYRLSTSLWLVDGNAVATSVTFESVERHIMPEPTLTLSDEDVQQWMDEMWRAGYRPTNGTGSAGALEATQKHLEDMRTLVFERRVK